MYGCGTISWIMGNKPVAKPQVKIALSPQVAINHWWLLSYKWGLFLINVGMLTGLT